MVAPYYRLMEINAPSQGGKTTIIELLSLLLMIELKQDILILSTVEAQSRRLLTDMKTILIPSFRDENLRELSTDAADQVTFAHLGTSIKAFPHSIQAVTGNPAGVVILDEVAKYEKDADVIHAEAVARTGKTHGKVLSISTFFGGSAQDPQQPKGYRGNMFHFKWSQHWKDMHNPHKETIALQFIWKASPPLVANIETLKAAMAEEFFKEHYEGVPRKEAGIALYGADFSKKDHVKLPSEIPLNDRIPLFLCYDPGLMKGAVLGQLDLDAMRLMYLLDFLSDARMTWEEFVRSVFYQCRKRFKFYDIQLFCDVAGNQKNRQTNDTDIEVISRVCNQWPESEYQNIAPGVQVQKSFMKLRNAFYVSTECRYLSDAFESGLVREERAGILQDVYKKDGYWEHVGDAARYPVYSLTGGYTAQSLEPHSQGIEIQQTPYVNPYTRY